MCWNMINLACFQQAYSVCHSNWLKRAGQWCDSCSHCVHTGLHDTRPIQDRFQLIDVLLCGGGPDYRWVFQAGSHIGLVTNTIDVPREVAGVSL